MDFHTLPRRDLQFLCKKNKIPANMTSVAMADALEALQIVEGMDEVLNDASKLESPKKAEASSPELPRTASRRASARRAPAAEEPKGTQGSPLPRSRRVTAAGRRRWSGKRGEAPRHNACWKVPVFGCDVSDISSFFNALADAADASSHALVRLKCVEFLLLLTEHVYEKEESVHEDMRHWLGEKCASLMWTTGQFGSTLDSEQRSTAARNQAWCIVESLEL